MVGHVGDGGAQLCQGDWGVVEVGREGFGILFCLGIVVSRECGWACW